MSSSTYRPPAAMVSRNLAVFRASADDLGIDPADVLGLTYAAPTIDAPRACLALDLADGRSVNLTKDTRGEVQIEWAGPVTLALTEAQADGGSVGPLDVAQARSEVEAAHSEVARLCSGGQWTMRIPAQEQKDSDLVIDRGLSAGEAALAEVERLRRMLGEALDLGERVAVQLVPVEVFGTNCQCGHPDCDQYEGGYGLMDAVEAWSDCNRAIGRIYRVEDVPGPRAEGDEVTVYVDRADLPWFERRFGEACDGDVKRARTSEIERLRAELHALTSGPVARRAADGTVTVDWPEGARSCLVSRDLFDEMVADGNRMLGGESASGSDPAGGRSGGENA